jgi:hypothetical protein
MKNIFTDSGRNHHIEIKRGTGGEFTDTVSATNGKRWEVAESEKRKSE